MTRLAKSIFRHAAPVIFMILFLLDGRAAVANSEAKILSPDDIVMVSKNAVDSSDPFDIVMKNTLVVAGLTDGHLTSNEVSRVALTSHAINYYLGEVNNGGFSQFVFNSGWDGELVELIRRGLVEIGAPGHLALFEKGAAVVKELGEDGLNTYFRDYYSDDNPVRDRLDEIDDPFFATQKTENLTKLNAVWLRGHPDLRVFSDDELQQEIDRRIAAKATRK